MSELGDDFEVRIARSRMLLLALLSIHLVAAAALFDAALTPLMRGALLLAIGVHACHVVLRHYLLREHDSLIALRWMRERWWLCLADGWHEATPHGECVVTRHVVAGRFALVDARGSVPLLLLPDSADADSLRRLRVRLRFGGVPDRS